jgi:hypothetical protein
MSQPKVVRLGKRVRQRELASYDYVRAAKIVQGLYAAQGVSNGSYARLRGPGEAATEAFVEFFKPDPKFDADMFRAFCKPERVAS